MGVLVSSFFALIFASIAIFELKTGKVLLRPFVTKETSPLWYWLEISVGLLIAGGFVNSTISTN